MNDEKFFEVTAKINEKLGQEKLNIHIWRHESSHLQYDDGLQDKYEWIKPVFYMILKLWCQFAFG